MRKRNISFIVDKLLWFIILILPLLFAMVFTCASMNNYTLAVDSNSYIVDTYYRNDILSYNGSYGTGIYYLYFNGSLSGHFSSLPSNSWQSITLTDVASLYYEDEIIDTFYIDFEYKLQYGNVFNVRNFIFYDDEGYYDNIKFGGLQGTVLSNNNFVVDIQYKFSYYEGFPYFGDYGEGYYKFTSPFDFLSFNFYVGVNSTNIFNTYFNNLNYSLDSWFTFGERDIVYNAFNSIFGSQSNILPIFVEGSFIPKYLTYMAWIYVLHLAFDFLVFIPRLAHKWMGGVYKDEDS